jgi:hypothetical protein
MIFQYAISLFRKNMSLESQMEFRHIEAIKPPRLHQLVTEWNQKFPLDMKGFRQARDHLERALKSEPPREDREDTAEHHEKHRKYALFIALFEMLWESFVTVEFPAYIRKKQSQGSMGTISDLADFIDAFRAHLATLATGSSSFGAAAAPFIRALKDEHGISDSPLGLKSFLESAGQTIGTPVWMTYNLLAVMAELHGVQNDLSTLLRKKPFETICAEILGFAQIISTCRNDVGKCIEISLNIDDHSSEPDLKYFEPSTDGSLDISAAALPVIRDKYQKFCHPLPGMSPDREVADNRPRIGCPARFVTSSRAIPIISETVQMVLQIILRDHLPKS